MNKLLVTLLLIPAATAFAQGTAFPDGATTVLVDKVRKFAKSFLSSPAQTGAGWPFIMSLTDTPLSGTRAATYDSAPERLVAGSFDHCVRKGFGRFLRQIVADSTC